MIVRVHSAGSSFKGLGQYLTHDPKAETEERVGWTHTLNLANDHVGSAIDEMMWTARDAELLKQEAGIRGGRATEDAVKHISLNWSPEDDPTREHMIETTEDFLRHMGWEEHQAILVCHTDRSHPHAHCMINVIHPETGLKLDDSFERRRAQDWAADYEREQGRIYCEGRLENIGAREEAPPRPIWMAFQNSEIEFRRAENALERSPENAEENPESPQSREWRVLKDYQRHEREAFFAGGKKEYSDLRKSVYRDVREEFRERWADYYQAVKEGGDTDALRAYKAELVAEQQGVLDTRRDAACVELRESRDAVYGELLAEQKEVRAALTWRQEAGLDAGPFFKIVADGEFGQVSGLTAAFRDTGAELTGKVDEKELVDQLDTPPQMPAPRERTGMRSGTDVTANIAGGLASGLASVAGSFADSFSGPRAPRQRPPAERPKQDTFEEAAAAARRRYEHSDDDAEWRKRQEERYWE